MSIFFGWFLSLIAILLIIIVLLQRGRGGGLAGALGGAGGQSAFGTKAGDMFTKITSWLAVFWICFCIFALRMLSPSTTSKFSGGSGEEQRSTANPGETVPAGDKSSSTTSTPAKLAGASNTGPASTAPASPSASAPPAATAGAKAPAAPAGK
jgi:preprotein translocase subunit SecG